VLDLSRGQLQVLDKCRIASGLEGPVTTYVELTQPCLECDYWLDGH
jgi:hypothetical protein